MLCCYRQDTGLTSHILLVPVPLKRLFYFENRDFDRVLKIGNTFKSNSAACFCLYLMSIFKKKIIWLRVIGTLKDSYLKGSLAGP